jgi:tripartite ATP-independent transporter DctP family solute receptor
MRSIARRSVLASAAGLCLPRWARAAEIELRYGGNLPASHPLSRRIAAAADEVATQTDGRVRIACFPDNALGGDSAMLAQVLAGTLDMMTVSGLILSRHVPVAAINGMPYAFGQYGAVWAAMDGPLGGIVRAALSDAGLHAAPRMFDNGYRQITTSTRPVATPADLHGLRLRVPDSPLWTSVFETFGARPGTLDFAQLHAALRDGPFEAQENALSVIEAARLYDVQRYCSLTNHMWDGFWLVINRARWDALPGPVQAAIAHAMDDAALVQRVEVRRLNDSLQDTLAAHGLLFNRPDPAPFKAVLTEAGFSQTWQERFEPEAWALLETETGLPG